MNESDWLTFATYHGLDYTDLLTMEGLARTAQLYYNWSNGRAFWGRDSMANLFVVSSKQFGTEIFEIRDGQLTINLNEEAMRGIWNYYYVPYISGYFAQHGRFRSEDVRTGEILAYVGSTVSAVFFPNNVTIDGATHPIEARILPAPVFAGGQRVMVNQGAGMVVTMATSEERYASLVFLQWFTDPAQNLRFSASSGYMPVREAAMDAALIRAAAEEAGIPLSPVTYETLTIVMAAMRESTVYATPPFIGGPEARIVLYNHIQDKAVADRTEVLRLIENGLPREVAIATFNTEANFQAWVTDLYESLLVAIALSTF